MENKSLLEKIAYILGIAKKGTCSVSELKALIDYSAENSDNLVLGRFMGYSVSEYAMACLKWIGSVETLKVFDAIMDKLPDSRKEMINDLIESRIYTEFEGSL